ncbi:MAG: hypothetical protein IT378_02430 [Sandaracinaceae bacterium]|nr:hypothetical protein [Sandaracinaceae bacterium]
MDESTLERAPVVVEDLALTAFRLVKDKVGFELDFTPETLPVLDHYLLSLRQSGAGQTEVAFVAPCAGAYFGEVVRRALPGVRWHCPTSGSEGGYEGWRLEWSHVFLWINPIGVAVEAITGEQAAGWNAHLSLLPAEREIVEQSLEQAGGVDPQDFFRLAIRYEVLEQATSVLETLAQRKGDTARAFGPDVYAAALGETPAIDA